MKVVLLADVKGQGKKDNKKHINEFVETLICDKRYDISRK